MTKINFRNEQEAISYKNLKIFTKIANKYIKPLILDGGALLGAYRDNGFAEDDWDDTDFTTFKDQWKNEPKLTKELLEAGFKIYHTWKPEDKRTPYS